MSILCETPERAEDLIASVGGEVKVADSISQAADFLNADPSEDLVVLGPSVAPYDALAFAEMVRMNRPAVGVVLSRDVVDNELLIQALQAGVREVVPATDLGALSAACYRSRSVSQRLLESAGTSAATGGAERRGGQVITVFAPKGGVGKTMLAVNLGIGISQRADVRVCVVDLDLAFGEVAISVGLDPARTLVDAVPMAGLDRTGVESLLTNYRPGLDMLLAPVVPGDAESITPTLVGDLLTVLRGMFDYIVVDTPPALTEHVLTVLDCSDHHVLVTTPEVPTLKNLRVALDTLDLLNYRREIRSVVLNRAGSKVGLSHDQLERVLQVPIAAHIPSKRAVPVALNKGVPIQPPGQPGHPGAGGQADIGARAHDSGPPAAQPARPGSPAARPGRP